MTDLKIISTETLNTLIETGNGWWTTPNGPSGGMVEDPEVVARFRAAAMQAGLDVAEDEEFELFGKIEEETERREVESYPDPATMTLDYDGWLGRLKLAQGTAAMACNYRGGEASDAQVRKLAHTLASNNIRVAQVQIRSNMLDKGQASHLIDAFGSEE